MKVYVCIEELDAEGANLVAVYASLDAAQALARKAYEEYVSECKEGPAGCPDPERYIVSLDGDGQWGWSDTNVKNGFCVFEKELKGE